MYPIPDIKELDGTTKDNITIVYFIVNDKYKKYMNPARLYAGLLYVLQYCVENGLFYYLFFTFE